MLIRRKDILRLTAAVLTTAYVALAVVLSSFHSHSGVDCLVPHGHGTHVHVCAESTSATLQAAGTPSFVNAPDLKTAPDHCQICQFYGKQIFAEAAAPVFVCGLVILGDRPEFTSVNRALPATPARGPPLV